MQSRSSQPKAIAVTESETSQTLLARAHRRTGDESRDAPGAVAQGPESIPSAAEIQRLVSGLTVQRTANGGLVIEAPPQTALTLGALFSGMAQLLQAVAAPPVTGGDPRGRQ